MTLPLIVLAALSVLLGFIGTPAWPWFHAFLSGRNAATDLARLLEGGVLPLTLLSAATVFAGIGLGWWFYGRKPVKKPDEADALEQLRPDIFNLLQNKYWVDELYEATVIRFNAWWAKACDWLDFWVWNGAVQLVAYLTLGLSWVNSAFDRFVINLGFDQGCERVTLGGRLMSKLQDGRVQHYLRVIGLALVAMVLILIWGGGK